MEWGPPRLICGQHVIPMSAWSNIAHHKVNNTTCHQGAYKPLYGVSMLKDYPFLTGTPAPRAAPKPGEKSNTVAMK